MSNEEMKNIWDNADDGDRINLDPTQLVSNLKDKLMKVERSLFFRDAREIGAAVLVTLFFGYKSFMENVFTARFAYLLIAIWSVYVIYRLLDVRKYKTIGDLNQSVKKLLYQQKEYLQQQAHLLDSALYWYIIPPAAFGMMAILGRSYDQGLGWENVLFSLVIILVMSYAVYYINKKAAKTSYEPLLQNIEKVLIQLEENEV